MKASVNSMKIGGHTLAQLCRQFAHKGGTISPEAEALMQHSSFTTAKTRAHINVQSFLLGAMIGGLGSPSCWFDVTRRLFAGGLDKLGAEAAINYLIQVGETQLLPGETYVIVMEPIAGEVFVVERQADGTFHLGTLPVTDIRVINQNTWAIANASEILRGRDDVEIVPLSSPTGVPSQELLGLLLAAQRSYLVIHLAESSDYCEQMITEGIDLKYLRFTDTTMVDELGAIDFRGRNYDLTPLGQQFVMHGMRVLLNEELVKREEE